MIGFVAAEVDRARKFWYRDRVTSDTLRTRRQAHPRTYLYSYPSPYDRAPTRTCTHPHTPCKHARTHAHTHTHRTSHLLRAANLSFLEAHLPPIASFVVIQGPVALHNNLGL